MSSSTPTQVATSGGEHGPAARRTDETLVRAALGAALITVLMLPFQALTPVAPYSPLLILPVLMFFALQAPPQALVGLFCSFAAGVGWAGLFLLVSRALPNVPLPVLMGVGVTATIFLILAVHPLLLGRTPFGIVPAVLLGTVESLLVLTTMPLMAPGAPRLDLLVVLGIFAYGCLMTLVLVVVERAVLRAVFGRRHRTSSEGA